MIFLILMFVYILWKNFLYNLYRKLLFVNNSLNINLSEITTNIEFVDWAPIYRITWSAGGAPGALWGHSFLLWEFFYQTL